MEQNLYNLCCYFLLNRWYLNKYGDKKSQIIFNEHSFAKYRCNVPLSRSTIFRSIYNVKKGDHMYWKNDTIWSNN